MKAWCEPVDVIAFIIIGMGMVLLFFDRCNQTCVILLMTVASFYFGLKSELPKRQDTQNGTSQLH